MLTETRVYLSCAETAKLVRLALKRAFPAVKFSIWSKTYAGGASIRVHWTDGPTSQQVHAITDKLEGADFDGMQDLKTYRTHEFIDQAGHVTQKRYGADYIFPSRDVSNFEAREAEALNMIRKYCQCEGEVPNDKFGGRWVSDLARQMVYGLNFSDAEPIQASFRRIVLMEHD